MPGYGGGGGLRLLILLALATHWGAPSLRSSGIGDRWDVSQFLEEWKSVNLPSVPCFSDLNPHGIGQRYFCCGIESVTSDIKSPSKRSLNGALSG